MTQCPNCGAGVRPDTVRCVKCGSVLRDEPRHLPRAGDADPPPLPGHLVLGVEPRNPAIALVLSLLVSGLGQLYNGQLVKGIVFFVVALLSWCVILGWVVHIVAGIEAYQTAKSQNRGVAT